MTLNLAENEKQAARIVSWGMEAHSFTSFSLRASTVGWREKQALVSRIYQMEKSRGLRSGLLAGQTSLLMNEKIFLWILNWVILEAWEGAESCRRDMRTPCRCFLAQGSRQLSKMFAIWRWEFNLSPESTKSRGNIMVSATAAPTMIYCGFWHLVTILPSVDDEEAQTLSFCWLTTSWMSNFFSFVNTRFSSVLSGISWMISLQFWALMATWLSASS